jgi:hypothetical protein
MLIRSPADRTGTERVARHHVALGVTAFHALKGAPLEALGAWLYLGCYHPHGAVGAARTFGRQ